MTKVQLRKVNLFSENYKSYHSALVHIIESLYELYCGALTTSAAAYQSQCLTGLYVYCQVLQYSHAGTGRVVEHCIFKCNARIVRCLSTKGRTA